MENTQSALLIKLAREAILSGFDSHTIVRDSYLDAVPVLRSPGASFVTLTLHGHLRGCIGSLVAHRLLIDDIISNAMSAAFRDPRFVPLSKEELSDIAIEVSLLTPPEPVQYKDAEELAGIIRPGVDGVVLRLGNHQATFLPQVWEELNDFRMFFAHLGLKAGIGDNPLNHHPDVFRYQVEKYAEKNICTQCS